jgi:hypothetical protein
MIAALAAGIAVLAAAAAPAADLPRVPRSSIRIESFCSDSLLAAYAVDEFPGSRWHSGAPQSGREWLRIDFPGEGELSRVELYVEGNVTDYPRELEVSASLDGTNFRTARRVAGTSPVTTVAFDPPLRCRAIRLEQKGSHPVFFWAVNDLRFWGRFPEPERPWWGGLAFPKAWAALLVLIVTGVAAWWADRRRKRPAAPPDGRSPWRFAAPAVAVGFGLLLLATHHHYGETWDEFEHFEQGEQYFQYLFGTGKIPDVYGHEVRRFYGPFSDILAAGFRHLFERGLGWMGAAAALHLHLILLFVAGGLVLFRVVRADLGARAAWCCLLAYCVSPHLLGHVHNNMKDFAVTGWTVLAVFLFHGAARRRSFLGMAGVGLLTAAAMATKVNGILLAPIFLVYAGVAAAAPADRRFAWLGAGVVHWVVALAATVLVWPWLWDMPWTKFADTVRFFAHHIWNGQVLFRGSFTRAAEVSRIYAPYYVMVTTPIAWIPFALAGLGFSVSEARRRGLLAPLVAAAFLTPIAVSVVTSAPRYDGIRHFLPAFPFLACLVGFGLDRMVRVAGSSPRRRGLATAAAAGVIAWVAVQDVRLHPYQSVYFNSLVGGASGASGRLELDYWGNSLKEAGRFVNERAAPGEKVHVLLGLGRLAKLRPDLVQTDRDPDWAIALERPSLAPDPWKDWSPVYAVVADGAVLARVYRLKPR